MTFPEALFILSNLAVLPFWALMILTPRWHITERIMRAWWLVAALAILYLMSLVAWVLLGSVDAARLTLDLNGVAYLLGTPAGAATAWLHLIAFDLFVGRWVYLDSRTQPIPAWLVAIALLFTLLTGPFGLLLYLTLRFFKTGS